MCPLPEGRGVVVGIPKLRWEYLLYVPRHPRVVHGEPCHV